MKNRKVNQILLLIGYFALSPAAAFADPRPQDVNVVNTPAVTVANTSANPVPVRDVDNPARQPFQAQVMGGFADGAATTGDITITTVPARKLLVVEHVSVLGKMIPNQRLVRAVFRECTGIATETEVTEYGTDASGSTHYFIASKPIRLYSQPCPISCFAERDSFAGNNPSSVTFTIFGYLMDCPTCQ